MKFSENDPFPLLEGESYAEERRHSAEADRWLGLRVLEIEVTLRRENTPPGQELWIGLDPESMQTPYTEIRRMLAKLAPPPGSRLVDLGAGYGRIGFVIGRHYPEIDFIGIEFLPERLEEARRCLSLHGYRNARMLQADLRSPEFRPPPAEFYFLYDFGSREAIGKLLGDLREIAHQKPITVVGRGRASRDAIERDHPWLSQVIPPFHGGNYSIYRS
jgi:hypothetical protein